jgi:hypothetical protein
VECLACRWWGKRAGPALLDQLLQSPAALHAGHAHAPLRRKFVRVGLAFTMGEHEHAWPSPRTHPRQGQTRYPRQRNVQVHEKVDGLPLPGDSFTLNLLRASASLVITTGKNVRLERNLVPGLFGPHARLLQSWRTRFVTRAPLTVWVLTQGEDPRALLTSPYFRRHAHSSRNSSRNRGGVHASHLASKVCLSILAPQRTLAGLRRVAEELGLRDIGFVGYCSTSGDGLAGVINDALHDSCGNADGSSSGSSSSCVGPNGGGTVVMEAGPSTANKFAADCAEDGKFPTYDLVALTSYVPHDTDTQADPGVEAPGAGLRNDAGAGAWPVDWQLQMRRVAQSRAWCHAHGKWTFQLWTRNKS